MSTYYSNGLRLHTPHPADSISEEDLYNLVLGQAAYEKAHPAQPKFLGLAPSLLRHVKNLNKIRWGVIWYPQDGKVTEQEKLHRKYVQVLIDQRQAQMGYKIPPLLYEEGWTVMKFLIENGVSPGNMNTASVPYYLLIVASPECIPWDFQQQLDGEYAVGRLWFDDPEDCKRYIDHLLGYESSPPVNQREVLVVGTCHAGDKNTQSSADNLVKPLVDWLKADEGGRGYKASLLFDGLDEQEALRSKLLGRLKAEAQPNPSILFTATHGLAETGEPEACGALVMQDWPGEPFEVQLSHCLAGDLAVTGLSLGGMVAFCFACFSAGVPREQDWVHPSTGAADALAPKAYVSRLPQKLLAGGLQAFIGHVSKAWGFSYLGVTHSSQQISTFTETLGELMDGMPVGHALDTLNQRSVLLSGVVGDMLEHPANYPSQTEVVYTWMARNDCRGHVLLGDPFASIKG